MTQDTAYRNLLRKIRNRVLSIYEDLTELAYRNNFRSVLSITARSNILTLRLSKCVPRIILKHTIYDRYPEITVAYSVFMNDNMSIVAITKIPILKQDNSILKRKLLSHIVAINVSSTPSLLVIRLEKSELYYILYPYFTDIEPRELTTNNPNKEYEKILEEFKNMTIREITKIPKRNILEKIAETHKLLKEKYRKIVNY